MRYYVNKGRKKMELNKIYNENCLKTMARMPDNFINLTMTSPTIIELISGSILNPKIENEKEKVIGFVSSFITLDLDKDGAIKSGEIEAELIKKGEKIQTEDVMIGAIALHNNETLLTRNKKHFEKIKGLVVESY